MNSTLKMEEEQLSKIKQVLIHFLQPKRIYLFGSRAENKAQAYSDFDIAIDGHTAAFRKMREVKEKLDEKLGIYSCDLVELQKVSPKFKQLILNKGRLIYERD